MDVHSDGMYSVWTPTRTPICILSSYSMKCEETNDTILSIGTVCPVCPPRQMSPCEMYSHAISTKVTTVTVNAVITACHLHLGCEVCSVLCVVYMYILMSLRYGVVCGTSYCYVYGGL